MNFKKLFNSNWEFAKTDVNTDISSVDSLCFKSVDLPHDWLIYNAKKLYENSFGWYKKICNFADTNNVRLYFEGVYMNCTLYINRKVAFEWKNGYSSFEADISDYIKQGENEIIMLVRHQSPNSRWYSGAGIYRNVWLYENPSAYIVTDSVYFSTEKSADMWNCTLSSELAQINCDSVFHIELGNLYSADIPVKAGETAINHSFSVNVVQDKIWNIDSPVLHNLTTKLTCENEILDEKTCSIGFRKIEFKPDSGFYLNDRHVKLHGVCLHHDLGCLGAAVNRDEIKRRLLLMKEMGVNAIRTSHNMPAVEMMELCDELGILVNNEAYDMWERQKTEFDNARFFNEWYQRDVKSWVCRDRNHPSMIMWSIGNEIYDTHVSERGYEVTKMLCDEVKKYDPKRNAYVTFGSNYMEWENTKKCAALLETVGYNYGERLYEQHHAEHSDWCIYGSETTAGVKSRGVYHFPYSSVFLTHSDMQCSSLGNCRGGFSAPTTSGTIRKDLDSELCAGMFIWTGIDYIGEPSPYFTKNSYYGQLDTAGIKKDTYWLYQAAWTSKPVLHLLPYWDFNEGQLIDICAYTNLVEAELFINGKSLGKKTAEDWQIRWQTAYQPGEIKVVGFTKDGQRLEDSHHSFGDSKRIKLACDKSEIKADGVSLAVIEVSTVDESNNPVENARDRITIKVTGGRLVGFDNGDSTDYDDYKSTCRKLFSGKAAAYIAAPTKPCDIVVTATSPNLEPSIITIKTTAAEVIEGISANEAIQSTAQNNEIPVRKILLSADGSCNFNPSNKSVKINAKILPSDATCNKLQWSIVTDSGIDENCAVAETCKEGAVITAKGDGRFRLRCSCNNEKEFPEVISELEFTSEGLGLAAINPYNFVVACLYRKTAVQLDEISNGGISIPKEKNRMVYTQVDFGKWGSDAITISMIHWHTDSPITFRVYDDEKLLGEYVYQQEFLWQTYKKQSYLLSEKLTGMHNIGFEFDKTEQNLHFGGFTFETTHRAGKTIPAIENDLIHGDTYEISENRINKIGNNVTIYFNNVDFGDASSLIITGKTSHDNDSIHVEFVDENGNIKREIIEFMGSENVTSVEQKINLICRKGTVKFIFLPGCDFDFESFRIE